MLLSRLAFIDDNCIGALRTLDGPFLIVELSSSGFSNLYSFEHKSLKGKINVLEFFFFFAKLREIRSNELTWKINSYQQNVSRAWEIVDQVSHYQRKKNMSGTKKHLFEGMGGDSSK